MKTFLSAHWENLLLANYAVDPMVLQDLVPAKTQLDRFEGKAYVSLVAFLFEQTNVLGIPIPFHRKFEEVNLRFYVVPDHDPSLRAVTFVKEIVPRPIIPLIANNLFHENYVSTKMSHQIELSKVGYWWGSELENKFTATVPTTLSLPQPNSLGEFITEHYWGYAKAPSYTLEYEVTHPQWKCGDVGENEFDIQVDFAKVYGEKFEFLNSEAPSNVQYAEGSAVTVSFPKRI